MSAVSNSAQRGAMGNSANLLRTTYGAGEARTGTSCLSDTLDLWEPAWIKANAAGNVTVLPKDNANGATVTIAMAAGDLTEVRVRRVLATGTTIADGSLVLLMP